MLLRDAMKLIVKCLVMAFSRNWYLSTALLRSCHSQVQESVIAKISEVGQGDVTDCVLLLHHWSTGIMTRYLNSVFDRSVQHLGFDSYELMVAGYGRRPKSVLRIPHIVSGIGLIRKCFNCDCGPQLTFIVTKESMYPDWAHSMPFKHDHRDLRVWKEFNRQ